MKMITFFSKNPLRSNYYLLFFSYFQVFGIFPYVWNPKDCKKNAITQTRNKKTIFKISTIVILLEVVSHVFFATLCFNMIAILFKDFFLLKPQSRLFQISLTVELTVNVLFIVTTSAFYYSKRKAFLLIMKKTMKLIRYENSPYVISLWSLFATTFVLIVSTATIVSYIKNISDDSLIKITFSLFIMRIYSSINIYEFLLNSEAKCFENIFQWLFIKDNSPEEAKNFSSKIKIRKTISQLEELENFELLLSKYFNPLIVTYLFYFIFIIPFELFFLLLEITDLVQFVTYLVVCFGISLICMIKLLFSPSSLIDMKYQVLKRLQKKITLDDQPRIEAKIERLIRKIKEDQNLNGINIYGLFTLNQAKIIDIGCFIITNVIILQQFGMSEREK